MDLCLLQRAYHYTLSFRECIINNKLHCTRFLYRNGARCNDCLILAAREGNLALVQFFHSVGVDIHAANELALRLAARGGFLVVVKYLVENGADIHAEDDLAFRWAAAGGHLTVVHFLHMHEAGNKELALKLAAANSHLPVVVYLHEIGGVNLQVENKVALRLACRGGNIEVIKYLYFSIQ